MSKPWSDFRRVYFLNTNSCMLLSANDYRERTSSAHVETYTELQIP